MPKKKKEALAQASTPAPAGAGAMVAKFRKERPEATFAEAKNEFAVKLGAKFINECAARGL